MASGVVACLAVAAIGTGVGIAQAQPPGGRAVVSERVHHARHHAVRPRPVRHQPAVRRVTPALAARPGFLTYVAGHNLSGPVLSRDAIMATSVAGTTTAGTATVAASEPGQAFASPAVSPDRKQIVYVEGAPGQLGAFNDQGDLVIAGVDGAHRHVVTSGNQDTNPVWSPSGTQIAFMRDMHIWIMSATGASPHSLGVRLAVNAIAWSPDGRQLAVGSGQGFSRIAIVTVATGTYRWFAPASAHQYDPSWSPDGQQLVYTTDAGRLFVARINGTGTHQITTCTGSCTEDVWPVWSPDGKTIAFDLVMGNSVQVAAVPARGGRVTVLTKAPQQHESPSW